MRPVHADQWIIEGPTGEQVGLEFYRTKELAAEAAMRLAKERGEEARMIRDAHGMSVEIEEGPYARRSGEPATLILDVSADLVAFLDKLAEDMGVDREEAVRLSLGLMRIAQNAKRQGNGLAIVTPGLDIEQEIGLD